jgi:putative hydrolase of the HAD superfamily
LLQSLEIALFFDSVTLPGPLRVEKPDALLFRRALADLGVEPTEAVYVGNDPAIDLAGARAAGLQALDVACLDSLAELPDRLATLGSRS